MASLNTPFFGGAYASRSTNFADSRLINLYPEVTETRAGAKAIGAIYSMPGYHSIGTAGAGPINAMHYFAGNGYLVSGGNQLYRIAPDFTITFIGTLPGGSVAPVSMADNGSQMGILANNTFSSFTQPTTITSVALGFVPFGQFAQLDGFGILAQTSSNNFFASNALDFTTWNGLSFGQAAGDGDWIQTVFSLHREIFVFKRSEIEAWFNAGTSPFPLNRLDGVYIQHGAFAPQSITRVGDSVIFLSQNEQGFAIVMELDPHRATRISHYALETQLQGFSDQGITINDAIGFAIRFNGHEWFVLTFPSANVTWVYDATVSRALKEPTWFQWMKWDGANFDALPINCMMQLNSHILLGSSTDGNIYRLSVLDTTDAGNARKWLRTWRALPKPTMEPTRFNSLTMDMETGQANANLSLRWSDDGGHTYSPTVTAPVTSGATSQRVMFKRLGATKRASGLDRIFELSSTDQFPAALIGATLVG